MRKVKTAKDMRKFEMVEDFESAQCILAIAYEKTLNKFIFKD